MYGVGIPSPSGRTTNPAESGGLQRNQTIGQRIMGNMMDNLFLRSLTSKPKGGRASDASAPPSPIKVLLNNTVCFFCQIGIHFYMVFFFFFLCACVCVC